MIIDMPTVSMGNSGSVLPADKVSYDNTTSGLEAENVQDAIDEVDSKNSYSSEETIVGYWRVGGENKPIYQKSYVFSYNSSSDYLIDTISSLDFLISFSGFTKTSDGYGASIPYTVSNQEKNIYSTPNGAIYMQDKAGALVASTTARVTIRYTKQS